LVLGLLKKPQEAPVFGPGPFWVGVAKQPFSDPGRPSSFLSARLALCWSTAPLWRWEVVKSKPLSGRPVFSVEKRGPGRLRQAQAIRFVKNPGGRNLACWLVWLGQASPCDGQGRRCLLGGWLNPKRDGDRRGGPAGQFSIVTAGGEIFCFFCRRGAGGGAAGWAVFRGRPVFLNSGEG